MRCKGGEYFDMQDLHRVVNHLHKTNVVKAETATA